jgi:hypothetical protein
MTMSQKEMSHTEKGTRGESRTGDSGSGYRNRLVVLMLILLLLGGAWLNDIFVKTPRTAELVRNMNQLIQTETDDGHGIPKDLIQKTLGLKPHATFEVKAYEVEEYEFRRTLPFFTLRKLFVVYQSSGAATFFEGDRRPTIDMIKRQLGPEFINQQRDPGRPTGPAGEGTKQAAGEKQDEHAGHDH